MRVTNINGVASHRRCVQHEVRQVIQQMSDEQKQRMLATIADLQDQRHDAKMRSYVENLLRPKTTHRNIPVS